MRKSKQILLRQVDRVRQQKPTEPVIPEKPGEEEKEPLSTKQIVAISIAGAVSGCSILGLIFYLIMKRIL